MKTARLGTYTIREGFPPGTLALFRKGPVESFPMPNGVIAIFGDSFRSVGPGEVARMVMTPDTKRHFSLRDQLRFRASRKRGKT